jgi:hypothetical protein
VNIDIGETERTVDVRINEHQNSIKKKDPDISKLTEHHFNTGHRILCDETEIIGREPNWRAQKIHEATAILKVFKIARSFQFPKCRDIPYLETNY